MPLWRAVSNAVPTKSMLDELAKELLEEGQDPSVLDTYGGISALTNSNGPPVLAGDHGSDSMKVGFCCQYFFIVFHIHASVIFPIICSLPHPFLPSSISPPGRDRPRNLRASSGEIHLAPATQREFRHLSIRSGSRRPTGRHLRFTARPGALH